MNGSRRTLGAVAQHEAEISTAEVYSKPKWTESQAFSVVSQESSGDMGAWFESGRCGRMNSDAPSTESGADGGGNTPTLGCTGDGSENGTDQAITHGNPHAQRAYYKSAMAMAAADVEKDAVTLGVNNEGGSLEDALRHVRARHITLDSGSVARIALQICSDMLQLHEKDIAWGAVDPRHVALSQRVDDNGTLPRTGQARISEFCARPHDAPHTEEEDDDDDGDDDGASARRYLAPESEQSGELDAAWKRKAADVFSFGLLLFEMLTSQRPLVGVNAPRPHWATRGGADFVHANCPLRLLVQLCCAPDPLSRPSARLLERRLSALTRRDRLHCRRHNALHCPNASHRPLHIPSTPMHGVLTAHSAASSSPAVVSERAAAELAAFHDDAFDSVTESESLTDSASDDASGGAQRAPRVSPLTSPEQRSPNLRHGATFPTQMSAEPLVHTRAASLSHVRHVQAGLDAIPSAAAERPLHRAESSKSKRSRDNPADDAAAAVYGEFAAQPHPHIISPYDVERDSAVRIQPASPSMGSSHEHVDSAVGTVDGKNVIDEHRISKEHVAEPESFSTSVTAHPLDHSTAPGEYPSSSMSSASFRRKSSKLRDVLIQEEPVAHLKHNLQPQMHHQPSPVVATQSYKANAATNDSRELEKGALDIIGASIAEGNYSAVLSTMKSQRKSHAVVVVSCTFLESICREERLYFDFCEEGGIEEFISAVLLFGKVDTTLCTVVFNSISALSTHRDDRVSHRLRGMGVPSVIIDMLSYYRADIAIQTAGCECLALMARSSKQSQTAIATLGGPGIVYRIITQNNSSFRNVDLARASLKAVRYMAEKNERAAEYLVEVAALDPVSSVAELFTENGIEQDILDALEAFSFYTNGRRSIIMSSGMKALAMIMLRNREPRFLVQCCNFIRAVARWNDPECETAVLQSGISERIVSLMDMSNSIVGVEGARLGWYACYACTFLASFGARSRQRLRRVGAVEGTIDVLRRRMEDPKVVHIATDALAELMKNEPEARQLAMDYNVVGCLKEALILHKGWSRVLKALQWTLEFLAAPEGSFFGPAYGSQSHREMMRESSTRTRSCQGGQKSQTWKSAFGFIRTPWKKS